MGQILHRNAKTTIRTRKEIQESKESIRKLATKYNTTISTISKWKNRESIEDKKTGPSKGYGSVLSLEDEYLICQTRKTTWLSLDDLLIILKDQIPKLTRSNLHRCLQRNGLSIKPPELDSTNNKKKKFKDYPPGFLHIDTAETYINKKKIYIFVSIDRTTKYVYLEIHDNKRQETAKTFVENTIKEYPYTINRILTDNGSEYTYAALLPHLQPKSKEHLFDVVCKQNNIEHRLTKFKHPWTNGQVERFNRTWKENTVKKYYYESVEEFKRHILYWLSDYNFNKKLKSLKFKTPFEEIERWYNNTEFRNLFKTQPIYKSTGQYNYLI